MAAGLHRLILVLVWASVSRLNAGPVVPQSVPVTVLYSNSIFSTAYPNLPRLKPLEETPGVLYTRLDPQDHESLSGRPLRMKPLIKFKENEVWDWDWRDAAPLAIAVDRLRKKAGELIFQTEDDTWAFGKAVAIRVRDGMPRSIYLSVRLSELKAATKGGAGPQMRIMDIPIEDVSDRVFSVPAKLEAASTTEDERFFLTNQDALLPITVLGFQGNAVWVCATAELMAAPNVRLLLVNVELLRRVSQVDLLRMKRIASLRRLSLEWLKAMVGDTVLIPENVDRLAFVKNHLEKTQLAKAELLLPRSNCRTMVDGPTLHP